MGEEEVVKTTEEGRMTRNKTKNDVVAALTCEAERCFDFRLFRTSASLPTSTRHFDQCGRSQRVLIRETSVLEARRDVRRHERNEHSSPPRTIIATDPTSTQRHLPLLTPSRTAKNSTPSNPTRRNPTYNAIKNEELRQNSLKSELRGEKIDTRGEVSEVTHLKRLSVGCIPERHRTALVISTSPRRHRRRSLQC